MQAGSDLGAIIFPQAAVETDTEFSVVHRSDASCPVWQAGKKAFEKQGSDQVCSSL